LAVGETVLITHTDTGAAHAWMKVDAPREELREGEVSEEEKLPPPPPSGLSGFSWRR